MSTMFRKIIVQTGNIIDMEEQIRLVGQTSAEELKGCVTSALNQWSADSDPQILDEEEGGTVVVQGIRKPLLYTGLRGTGISTTAKIFLSDNLGDYVTDAIKTVMRNVDRDSIENVILAPPDVSDDVTLQDLMEAWRALERAVDEGYVSYLGIADVSYSLFKELYEWSRIKPTTIQINLDNCCSVSDEMREFARAYDVQMLTHSDNPDMLDEDVVTSILTRVEVPQAECQVQWLARHRTIMQRFGLILDKGYTIAIDCAGGND